MEHLSKFLGFKGSGTIHILFTLALNCIHNFSRKEQIDNTSLVNVASGDILIRFDDTITLPKSHSDCLQLCILMYDIALYDNLYFISIRIFVNYLFKMLFMQF